MTLEAAQERSSPAVPLHDSAPTAAGEATLILKGCRLLNVYSGVTEETDITI